MKKKGKISGIDIYLVSVLVFAAAFVIAEEARLWFTDGQEASQIAQGIFTMVTGELFSGVLLYRFKIKKKKEDES